MRLKFFFFQQHIILSPSLYQKEYKSYAQSLTDTKFTEANRDATFSLLQSMFDDVIDNIARSRWVLYLDAVTHFYHVPQKIAEKQVQRSDEGFVFSLSIFIINCPSYMKPSTVSQYLCPNVKQSVKVCPSSKTNILSRCRERIINAIYLKIYWFDGFWEAPIILALLWSCSKFRDDLHPRCEFERHMRAQTYKPRRNVMLAKI